MPVVSKRLSVYAPIDESGHVTSTNITKAEVSGGHVVPSNFRRRSHGHRRHRLGVPGPSAFNGTCSSRLMTVASLSQDLYEFAVELRRLAYTMPSGHEDRLIQLSNRMVRCASQQAAE